MSSRGDQIRNRLSIDPDEPPPLRRRAAAPAPEPAPKQATPPEDADRRWWNGPPKKKPDAPDALADPDINIGTKNYRSFYIEDEAFARFRAAVHWSSRLPDADDDVPDNMSAAVEAWMLELAQELEHRYNRGRVFRMPPKIVRRKRPTSQ